MATAVDIQSGDIPYEYYINSLMVNSIFIEVPGEVSDSIRFLQVDIWAITAQDT